MPNSKPALSDARRAAATLSVATARLRHELTVAIAHAIVLQTETDALARILADIGDPDAESPMRRQPHRMFW